VNYYLWRGIPIYRETANSGILSTIQGGVIV
jgi:hypothetical protein